MHDQAFYLRESELWKTHLLTPNVRRSKDRRGCKQKGGNQHLTPTPAESTV
jgi:hypothetical protein